MTYTSITVSDKLYVRTDKNVTCVEFKLNNRLTSESFTKLLSNLKTAYKGSQVKVYYTKAIFERDEQGNFIPDPKRMGFNKSHDGFLVETGTNFDKPLVMATVEALDKTITKAIEDGVYTVELPKVKTATKAEMELTISEQAELLATLKEKDNAKDRRIAYLENILKKNGIKF